ncbi:deazaflavin-dependent oxidoreductase (nitroreductase family) [Saccharopolyspora lacisalsi]|uniref:Deazaflavin-dependent oxidoreductase (Nitroreductase family) n=1 Tax=Halosaccharopolyspora lacisalsi TaxID=1000566 RepID=A0A839DVR7_9PSEU|nr:deazaflavin-dependent oxidoreductase (nitroreductase family) [Halosaccharopolyspora lacisalsi]
MRTLTRLTQQLSHHNWAGELALRLAPVERTLLIRSRGRRSITGALGVPLLLLGVRGARSGLHRAVPLIHTEDEDGHLVLGSHGGRPKHPQWSYDLLCEPRATVTLDGITIPVHASLLTGRERDGRWPLVLDTWPPYETYTRRSGRELRMFLLRPDAHR